MTAKIAIRHREENAARAIFPLTAENLITAARILPEWTASLSVYWEGGRFNIFTLLSVSERDTRQLASGSERLAADMVAEIERDIADYLARRRADA